MSAVKRISASEFKASCLDIMNRLHDGEWERVEVTRRGRVVAVMLPPASLDRPAAELHGAMRDTVLIPPDLDLTAPVSEEPWLVERGILHS